ncbi:sigma-70 family RNA polymerase sigma factor [Paenibacillus sp. FSL M8-0334]|uniref:Sigma-70 family RNA polymerase sigma factor n=1 Tax=Paenibacillus campinasensis TaxID=66347 RepID=A0ABW9SZZ9_9BACL|nr:sigma-70 family RNA polymerase sigma factor [Paenibacillus campinasensis]MUG65861.1 sigma-70 family RNA polymerase sigma factor [Paenibacillus campinasensis]
MNDQAGLAAVFEAHRAHLHGVAYRMLGSLSEAEDAVQEAWLRLSRSDVNHIHNIGGWLTTVVSRICLDMLRARKTRKEESLEEHPPEALAAVSYADPEQEAVLADSVGVAMLVVLDRLKPAERISLILHDVFGMPFHEIASIIGKSDDAARQLTSRARRRIRGAEEVLDTSVAAQRDVVRAFLAAAHAGDLHQLIAALDPDVVLRDDREDGTPRVFRGASALAKKVAGRAQKSAQLAWVDGSVGIVAAPGGNLLYVLKFTVKCGIITEVELISNPERLHTIDLGVLNYDGHSPCADDH